MVSLWGTGIGGLQVTLLCFTLCPRMCGTACLHGMLYCVILFFTVCVRVCVCVGGGVYVFVRACVCVYVRVRACVCVGGGGGVASVSLKHEGLSVLTATNLHKLGLQREAFFELVVIDAFYNNEFIF